MRWMLGWLAAVLLVVAVACGPKKVYFSSVDLSGNGFLVANYVPLSGGQLQWTGVGDSQFTIHPIGEWCLDLRQHTEGLNSIVTCRVAREANEGLFAYVIEGQVQGGLGLQQICTVPVGPCKGCSGKTGTARTPPTAPPPPPGAPLNAIYCNKPGDPASVFLANGGNTITAPVGTTVYWVATGGNNPTGSIQFANDDGPCDSTASFLGPGTYLSCKIKQGAASATPYNYTATDSNCSGGPSRTLTITVPQ